MRSQRHLRQVQTVDSANRIAFYGAIVPAMRDPTRLVLKFEETDWTNGFIDSSSYNQTVLNSGAGGTISSTDKKSGVGSYSSSHGGYISVVESNSLQIRTQPFTYEMWVKRTTNGQVNIFSCGNLHSDSSFIIALHPTTGEIYFYYPPTKDRITTTAIVSINTWAHVAVTRDKNSTLRVYLDGVLKFTKSDAVFDAQLFKPLLIGGYYNPTGAFVLRTGAFFDNIRLSINKVVYTSNFTPPTTIS